MTVLFVAKKRTDRKTTYEWNIAANTLFTEHVFERGQMGKDRSGKNPPAQCVEGLSESQKNSLRDIIESVEWYYESEKLRFCIVFMMCPEHPLNIDPEESSADGQYKVMKMLLEWALDHVVENKTPTSHSTFELIPRPPGYNYFGPDPYIAEISGP
ncbi:hypothetical protein BELL_0102g00240 [Botrytis elliptica]|uniref:Uncharacterized protein n=1 Tax=Botrytis elliptica TaxID=278938 RepID=A0A4Z1K254_9HELO|nr:hypothetical protein BELL_0102g00240 [Botrytis elliptica]